MRNEVTYIIGSALRKVKDLKARLPIFLIYKDHPLSRAVQRRKLLDAISKRCGIGKLTEIKRKVTETGSLVILIHTYLKKEQYIVAKIPLIESCKNILLRQFEKLRRLESVDFPDLISVPKPLDSIWVNLNSLNLLVTLETALSGIPVNKRLYTKHYNEDLQRAVSVWEQLADALARCPTDQKIVLSKIDRMASDLKAHGIECYDIVSAIRAYLSKNIGYNLLVGLTHGDFWPGNLFFQDNSKVSIIDWEGMEDDGLPELDLFHYIIYSHAVRHHISSAYSWIQLMTGTGRWNELLSRYTNNQLQLIGTLYWLDILSRRRTHLVDLRWRNDMIVKPMKLMRKIWT